MKSTFVLAQMASVLEPEENLKMVQVAAKEAYEAYHPQVLVFPEYCMSSSRAGVVAPMEPLDGPFVTQVAQLAKTYGMWIIFGMNEEPENPVDQRSYNTTVVLNNAGEVVATYRKTHLYEAGQSRESERTIPGEKLFEPIDTPFGKLGLMICYELRFPEVARYQKARGAEIVVVPTSWVTGKIKSQQFNTLVRARAMENEMFVLACNQCHGGSTGESLAADPFGIPVACAGGQPVLVAVRVDTDQIKEVERLLPSYQNRRPELY